MTSRRPAYGGIPDNLRDLYERGERVRYGGFWLNETPRDRAIAAWIDRQHAEGRDVADLIKDMIYQKAVGTAPADDMARMAHELAELRRLIESGALVRAEGAELPADDVADLLGNLGAMAT